MINETIEELRELKTRLERTQQYYGADPCEDVYTLDKAIIACEQLRKYRKKAKRWKRKYLELREQVEKNMKLEALYDRLMAEKGEPNKETLNGVFLKLSELGIQDMVCAEEVYRLIFITYEIGFNTGFNERRAE